MPNDSDFYKKDKWFSSGKIEGHSDSKNKIREKDGFFSKGKEIGYIDDKKKIREKDSFLTKGKEIGQIKDLTAYDKDIFLTKGKEFGYIDENNNIRQKDSFLTKGRVIGVVKGTNRDAALGYFVLKFKKMEDRYDKLKADFEREQNKGKFLYQINKMLEYVPQSDSLGDFDALLRNLEHLKKVAERYLKNNLSQKQKLISRAAILSTSTDWKNTAIKFKELMREWKSIGQIPKEYNESTWNEFQNYQQKFYDNRKNYFDKLDRERKVNLEKKKRIINRASLLSTSTDWKNTAIKFKELMREWKSVGAIPKEFNNSTWDEFRKYQQRFYDNRKRYFDKLDKERESNLRKKRQIINKACALCSSTDWGNTGNRFKELLNEWKSIGQVPKESADAIWDEFRKCQQRFYDNRKSHFDKLDRDRESNLVMKQRLISRAYSLSLSTDWKNTGKEFKQLMSEWKSIGQIPKNYVDSTWNEFRGYQQDFYNNREKHFEKMNREWVSRMHDKIDKLQSSIYHDEGNISNIRDKIYSVRPGKKENELKELYRGWISEIENKIASKKEAILEIRNKLRK